MFPTPSRLPFSKGEVKFEKKKNEKKMTGVNRWDLSLAMGRSKFT